MKRVLFLFSDTGGGHRAAAEAIRDALYLRYENQVRVEMIDVFRAYTPFPFKYMPEMYPWIINYSKTSWGLSYRLTNTKESARLLSRGMYVSIEKGLKRMFREHPADVVVCVHSILTNPSMSALSRAERRPPFITVVTDLVSTHMFWYDKRVDRCLVPTQPAFERGLESGLKPEQMRITGLPVHPRFAQGLKDKASARRELGWDANLPTILMVGGGEGMGPLFKTARAINDADLKCQLVIIAGRNKLLKDKLEASDWNQPTHIYPFVTNMPTLMAAADILVTKAGPATISEACIAGLPLILNDAIPGQETGNVDYVVENGAGVFAPSVREVVDAVTDWLTEGKAGLQRRSDNARRLGRPEAVWTIADEVWQHAHKPLIPTNRRAPIMDLPRRALR
ncbi:MAG: glycosyltransferase [Chloroflexi bacterium]|nr:glycosyltransferase [Chloroflexota bacterium]